ncbi:hypothetical protein PR048_004302 [Dryococelus australis]|uniref:Uncharacterized protein n=1 Tax=Dryococelus australis TaxID=614101 RepID=A0ABQ9I531_9NEOP|nr:hypothetical protein PR048_004302 [Dryococelus australis]
MTGHETRPSQDARLKETRRNMRKPSRNDGMRLVPARTPDSSLPGRQVKGDQKEYEKTKQECQGMRLVPARTPEMLFFPFPDAGDESKPVFVARAMSSTLDSSLRGRVADLQSEGRGSAPRRLRRGRCSARLSHWEFVNKSVSLELRQRQKWHNNRVSSRELRVRVRAVSGGFVGLISPGSFPELPRLLPAPGRRRKHPVNNTRLPQPFSRSPTTTSCPQDTRRKEGGGCMPLFGRRVSAGGGTSNVGAGRSPHKTLISELDIKIIIHYKKTGAAVTEWLACLPPTKAWSPNFRKWESCRTMPFAGGFSRGSPVSPALSFRRCSILTSITLIGSQDHDVKNRPNLFPHIIKKNCFKSNNVMGTNKYAGRPKPIPGFVVKPLDYIVMALFCPVAPSRFETRSEIDTENWCTIRVQSWTGDRDEVPFEPPKWAVRNLDPRSTAIRSTACRSHSGGGPRCERASASGTWVAQLKMAPRVCWGRPNDQGRETGGNPRGAETCEVGEQPHCWILRAVDCRCVRNGMEQHRNLEAMASSLHTWASGFASTTGSSWMSRGALLTYDRGRFWKRRRG